MSALSATSPSIAERQAAVRPSLHVESNEDTSETVNCEFGVDRFGRLEQRNFTVVDTGRKGPDDVRVVIHEDGRVTLTINGDERTYAPDDPNQPDFLRVRVDANDTVHVEDRRPAADKLSNPEPVQVFTYEE